MLQLPPRFATVILSFAPLFFQRSWRHAEVLLLGAILAPGRRTVSRLLCISGLAQERHFVNYHRVLTGAPSEWKMRSRVAALVSAGPSICRDGHRVLAAWTARLRPSRTVGAGR